jgi:hypothetical protein
MDFIDSSNLRRDLNYEELLDHMCQVEADSWQTDPNTATAGARDTY